MSAALISCLAALFFQAAVPPDDAKPIIDNQRVTVWELNGAYMMPAPATHAKYDTVVILFAKNQGTAFFVPKGPRGMAGGTFFHPEKTVQIALKDHAVAPLPNKSGYPAAFPRPGIKKLIDNDRVTVWDYTWEPGKPTPMHYHDKDVVVVYLDDGALQSTTPDGKKVVNSYTYGLTKFNPRDRTHTELLVSGHQHAIMMELK